MKVRRTGPAFYVEAGGENPIVLTVVDAEGREKAFPATTPAEALLNMVEIDYTALRDKVLPLRKRPYRYSAQFSARYSTHQKLSSHLSGQMRLIWRLSARR